jgi:hypothetical protein
MFGSAAEVSMGLLVYWDRKFKHEDICKRFIYTHAELAAQLFICKSFQAGFGG